VRQALGNLAADWLTRAGVQVPRKDNGDAAVALEISPLVALDAAELRGRLKGVTAVTEPRYFGDD
jgi:hypothetical protein